MKNKWLFIYLAFLLTVAAGTVGYPHSVEAHSKIDEMKPGINEVLEYSPDEIEILFADPVEIYSESVRIMDQHGTVLQGMKPVIAPDNKRRVTLPLPSALERGKYTVEILAIAQDGHEITERYQFEIKKDKPVDSNFWRNLHLAESIPADGELVQTSPKTIELWFSDDVELDVIGLYDDKQQAIAIGNSYVDPENPRHYIVELNKELASGSYEVNWYAKREQKSKNGIFYFAVEEVTSITAPEGNRMAFSSMKEIGFSELANWLTYTSVFLLFGGMFFTLFISKGTEELHRWNKISITAFIIAAAGFLFMFVIRLYEFANISFLEFISFYFVWGILIQLVFVLVAAMIKSLKIKLTLLSGVILMWALSGHSVSERYGGVFSILLDGVHLFSTAVWFGGLFALFVMIPKQDKKDWIRQNGKRFSRYALISTALMFATGFAMMFRYLPSFSFGSLMMSSWGQFLLVKIALFAFVVFLGAWQMNMLKNKHSDLHADRFVFQARAEIMIGLAILFFAAALVNASPRTAEQGIYPVNDDNQMAVSIEIDPFRSGYNDMVMTFEDPAEVKRVDVEFFMPPNTKRTHRAFEVTEGVYQITGGIIHASGTLQVTLHILKSNGETVVQPYQVQIPGEM